jgi:integrase
MNPSGLVAAIFQKQFGCK